MAFELALLKGKFVLQINLFFNLTTKPTNICKKLTFFNICSLQILLKNCLYLFLIGPTGTRCLVHFTGDPTIISLQINKRMKISFFFSGENILKGI